MKMLKLSLAALLLTSAAPAHAKEVAGVNLPDTVNDGGKTLKLNGAGIRKKFIIKVYVGGLYLENPATSLKEIISSGQSWSVHMHFLRNVEKDKIVGAFKEGFEKNSKDKAASLQGGLDKISATVHDLNTGNNLVVNYVAGKGTTVGIQGGPSVTIEGKEFADALLRNWLGSEPADGSLKEAMLSGK